MRPAIRLILALTLLAAPLRAQRGAQLHVQLAAPGSVEREPGVSVSGVLDDAQLRELMRNGFPVALHFRLELWRLGGVFNELERATRWDVLVQYDPAPYRKAYRVVRRANHQTEDFGSLPTLDATDALLAQPYRVALLPGRAGARYYYTAVLEVESLSANDLSELQRWLHGDLGPAVRGKGNPLSALSNGIGRLLSRVLGGTKRNYEATSPTFVAGPP